MVKKAKILYRTSSLLFKELLRSIKGNIKQFFSVIAISFLAVCLFSGLTSNAYNIKERTDLLYKESNYADIYVTTSGLEDKDLDEIKKIKDITYAEKRAEIPFSKDKGAVNLVASDPSSTLSVPMMVDGIRNEDGEGFVVCQTYLKGLGMAIGDTLTIDSNNYFLDYYPDLVNLLDSFKNNEEDVNILSKSSVSLSFKITGTMMHPESVKTSLFISSTLVYTTYKTVEKSMLSFMEANYNVPLLDKVLASQGQEAVSVQISSFVARFTNQILALSSNVEESLDGINNYFNSKSDSNLVLAQRKENLTAYKGLQQDIDQALQLTFVFPVIFFLVSLLVILTTISQIIIRERTQIGSLKAIGVSKGQIYAHYMSYGFFLTLLGTVLGFFVGPLFIPDVMNIKYKILWDIPSLRPHFFYSLSFMMALIMLLISIFASFLVSYSVVKEKPVDTLRPKVPHIKNHHKDDKKPLLSSIQVLSSKTIPFKMAIRNMTRNKLKTTMVILGTLGCTALLVCGFGIMNSLDNCLATDYEQSFQRDIVAVPTKPSGTLYDGLNQIEGVEKCYGAVQYPISLSFDSKVDSNINLIEEGCPCFTPIQGVEGGVVIDKPTAEKLGCKEGDTIKVIIYEKIYTREVKKVFTSSSLHGIYDYMTYNSSSDEVTSVYSASKLSVNNYWIDCKKGADPESVKENIRSSYPDIFDTDSALVTQKDMFDIYNELLSSVRTMTRVVEIFAILLSSVVIYNLTSLNIAERTRDIATMKVLGFRYGEIARTLIIEIMLDTLIGTAIGLPLGFPLCVLVMAVNKNEFITYLYHITWQTYLLSAAISLLSALVVNLLLTLRTKKIKMVESLKSVE
jgi:putative ABC transport system permease protein